jgi:hypothetical protein
MSAGSSLWISAEQLGPCRSLHALVKSANPDEIAHIAGEPIGRSRLPWRGLSQEKENRQ